MSKKCVKCGKKLSIYNPHKKCWACIEGENLEEWVTLNKGCDLRIIKALKNEDKPTLAKILVEECGGSEAAGTSMDKGFRLTQYTEYGKLD